MAFDKKQYDKKYNAENTTRKSLVFNKKDPEDRILLEYLNAKGARAANEYIKELIRDDMKTGVWYFFEEPDEYYHYECSECGTWFSPVDWDKDKYKHCPHCGVKMSDS